jgi:hypothetical protein
MKTVLIAIPAFNEATTVRRVVEAASVYGPVLVIDDGSTDGTGDAARAGGATVIRHERRRGKGAALATAVGAARDRGASLLITLDADGQHDPADLPALHAAALAAPQAILVGSRPDSTLPGGRALAIHLAGYWVNWITGHAVADTQSGFRIYPVTLFDDVPLRGGRFVFETAVLVDAIERGWAVCEVPIHAVPAAARASRFHPLGDGIAIAAYLTGHALRRWGTELAAALSEAAHVLSRERRIARHTRMLVRASVHSGGPAWSAAVGFAALAEMRSGTTTWWHHPRTRRARQVALATLAAPVLLAVLGGMTLVRRALPRALEGTVRRLYDQRRLVALELEPHDSSGRHDHAFMEAPSR